MDYTWVLTLAQWEGFSSSITDSQMIKSILKIGGSVAVKDSTGVISSRLIIDVFDTLKCKSI